MTTPQIIVGILAVAIVTAGLYLWGLRKSLDQQEDLNRKLLAACGSRVVKALKKQPTITVAEAARLIEGVAVGQVWSRSRLRVENGKQFASQVLEFLRQQLYIEKTADGSYKLK